MPRRLRCNTGGFAYHALDRAVGRATLFRKDGDYAAFEKALRQAKEWRPVRLLGYCLMPNHWHLVLWPEQDGGLSEFLRWLTVTHTQRYHAHYHTAGTGPLYQGRFRSFPIQEDEHLLSVLRYVGNRPPAPWGGDGVRVLGSGGHSLGRVARGRGEVWRAAAGGWRGTDGMG